MIKLSVREEKKKSKKKQKKVLDREKKKRYNKRAVKGQMNNENRIVNKEDL